MKNGTRCLLQVGVRDWESLGTVPWMMQKGFCETVAYVIDAEGKEKTRFILQKDKEGRKEFLYTSRLKSSQGITILT